MTTRVEHDTEQIVIRVRKQDELQSRDAMGSRPPGTVALLRRGVMLGVRRGGGGGGGGGNGNGKTHEEPNERAIRVHTVL